MIYSTVCYLVCFFVFPLSYADKNATIPAPVEHCETVFSFQVTHAMAPMSRILVYYVLKNDEGVADSLTLDVAPSFENQVSFNVKLGVGKSWAEDRLVLT